MSGLPKDFFGSVLGTWWRPKDGGPQVEVNGWSMPGQRCHLSDGREMRALDLFAQFDFVGHRPAGHA